MADQYLRGQEPQTTFEPDSQDHPQHAPDGQRGSGRQQAQVRRAQADGPALGHDPDEEPKDGDQGQAAADKPRRQVAAVEGDNVEGDGDYAAPAQRAWQPGTPTVQGRAFGKEPQARGEKTQGDPTQSAGMDMGHQRLVVKVDDVQSIQYSDNDRQEKDKHRPLKQQPGFSVKRAILPWLVR